MIICRPTTIICRPTMIICRPTMIICRPNDDHLQTYDDHLQTYDDYLQIHDDHLQTHKRSSPRKHTTFICRHAGTHQVYWDSLTSKHDGLLGFLCNHPPEAEPHYMKKMPLHVSEWTKMIMARETYQRELESEAQYLLVQYWGWWQMLLSNAHY